MATMLRFEDSVERHLEATGRHQRLCRQVNGAQKYAQAIEPQCAAVHEKNIQYQKTVTARIHAYDDLVLHNRMEDDGIRTVFEKCNQYERENPGDPVLHIMFPHETFGEIVRKNMFKEPDTVEQLAAKFETLGENHALYPLAAFLRGHIAGMRQSVEAYQEAVRNEKVAQAQVEMAKNYLRDQYEANYLDARKEMGRKHAEYLFPKLTNKPVAEVPVEPDGKVAETAKKQ